MITESAVINCSEKYKMGNSEILHHSSGSGHDFGIYNMTK